MLKRLKNIEDKTDNQLVSITDQEDIQLDLIDEINAARTKSIGFKNERLKNLEKEIRNKEKEVRKNKRSKKKKRKIKLFLITGQPMTHLFILVMIQNY